MGNQDKIDFVEMWQRQVDQQAHWRVTDIQDALKESTCGIIEEAVEVQKALGLFKQNITSKPLNVDQALIQCVDVFKYVLTTCIILGITPTEFAKAFNTKTSVVDMRWAAQNVSSDKPIIVLDLDGVLAEYDSRIKAFRAEWYRARGINNPNRSDYEESKFDFRQVGGYLGLPLIPLAGDAVGELQRRNIFTIGVLTSRPAHKCPRIYSDTLAWLEQHFDKFDFVQWDQDKVEMLAKLPTKPWAIVEDTRKHVIDMAMSGHQVIWFQPDSNDLAASQREVAEYGIIIADGWEATIKAIYKIKQEKESK